MKKIVYIAQSAGGVAEYLYMFLKNFKSNDYENILIVSEDYNEQLDRFKPYVKEIYIVPMIRNLSFKNDMKAIFKLNKILNKISPDIVYLNSSKAGALGKIALLFNFKAKIIYNAHGWYFTAQISDKKKKIFAFIEKILALKTNKIINISKSEYDAALKYKIASTKKMCIIENGIDFSKFNNSDEYRQKTREQYNFKKSDIVIGVVGRLAEQKDPMTTIKAFKLVKEKYKNTKLLYVGSGELEDEVMQYAKDNNIDKDAIITGWTQNVEKYIPAFDIAILPSKWEGFGLVIIEYMACNKPIVATNVGGIKDIIKDKENGLLIESNNEKDLAAKIEELIENEELKNEIVQCNVLVRKRYDIEQVIQKHKTIFE